MIRARRFELVDGDGRLRAELRASNAPDGGGGVSLTLFDRQGRARAAVEVDDTGAAFGLNEASQEARVASISVRDPEPSDRAGNICLHLRPYSDEQDEGEVEISVAPGGAPLIATYNREGGITRGDIEERLARCEEQIKDVFRAREVSAAPRLDSSERCYPAGRDTAREASDTILSLDY